MSRRPQLRDRLAEVFTWRTDRGSVAYNADITGWLRDPVLLREIGPALGTLFDERPTVVAGPAARCSVR